MVFLNIKNFSIKNYKFLGKTESIFWKLGLFLSSLRKPHVQNKFGSWNNQPRVTPIDAIFVIFYYIEWTITQKVHVWPKWFFGYWKRYLRTIYPWKISHRALVDHEIWPPQFLQLLNDPKWILVIISSLEYQINLILHIMIVLIIPKELEMTWLSRSKRF